MDFQRSKEAEVQRSKRITEHDQLYLSIGGVSRHFDDRVSGGRFNESNPGVGLQYEWGDPGMRKYVTGGRYENSYDRDSYYLAGGIKKRVIGNDDLNASVGILGGAVSGYAKKPIPAVMPMLTVEGRRGALNFMYMPQRGNDTSEAVMLNTQIKLK